jgi:hypothetical protein
MLLSYQLAFERNAAHLYAAADACVVRPHDQVSFTSMAAGERFHTSMVASLNPQTNKAPSPQLLTPPQAHRRRHHCAFFVKVSRKEQFVLAKKR